MEIIGSRPKNGYWGSQFRLYGTKVRSPCPKCGAPSEDDLGRDPVDGAVNRAIALEMCCGTCHHDWQVHITLQMEVRPSTVGEIADIPAPAPIRQAAGAAWDPDDYDDSYPGSDAD